MTLAKYRLIDLSILTFVMCVLDAASIVLTARMATYFVVSLSTIMLLIITVRWSAWTFIPAVIGGVFAPVLMNVVSGNTSGFFDDIAVYVVGNCLLVSAELLYFKLIGKSSVTAGNWYLVLYAFIGFAVVCLARAVMQVIFKDNFIAALTDNVKVEALNFALAIIILFITNRQESVLCDQKQYFLEVRSGGKNEN